MVVKLEHYKVKIVRDLESGIIVSEKWMNRKGNAHRPVAEGPAYIERDAQTGAVTMQVFCENGWTIDPRTGCVPLDVERPHKRTPKRLLANRPPTATTRRRQLHHGPS